MRNPINIFSRFKYKKYVLVALGVLGFLIAGQFVGNLVKGNAVLHGTAQPVETKIIRNVLTFDCEVLGNKEKAYKASSAGAITYIPIKIGDHVAPGQVIAKMNSSNTQSDFQAASDEVNKIRTDIQKKKKAYEEAKLMYEKDLGTQQAVIDAKKAYSDARSSDLSKAQSKLQEAGKKIRQQIIVNEFAGVVTDQLVYAGDQVSDSQSIATVTEMSQLFARFYVSGKYKGKLRRKLAVQYLDSTSLKPVCKGEIKFVGEFNTKKGVLVEASFIPENPQQALDYYKQHMQVSIKVAQTAGPVPAIPVSAVYIDKKGPYVYELVHGLTKKIRVTLGFVGNEDVEIINAKDLRHPVVSEADNFPVPGMAFRKADSQNVQ